LYQSLLTDASSNYHEKMTSSRVWVLPDEPPPVRLMNTVWADRHGVHDSLDSTAALVDWLAVTGLAPRTQATRADLSAALRLRDALRRLAAETTGDKRVAAASPHSASAALSEVNGLILATHVPPALLCGAEGFEVSPALAGSVVTVALATVALRSLELLAAPSPLRACQAPGCVLYFVKDHPRRAWCSLGCGNRVRAARHYARSKAGATR
jgi:predicted RNA-binding Zn ribbon-like protein